MRRFSIFVMAGSLLVWAGAAVAQEVNIGGPFNDTLIVQSKTFSNGSQGTIGLLVSNDTTINGAQIPLQIRETVPGGAFGRVDSALHVAPLPQPSMTASLVKVRGPSPDSVFLLFSPLPNPTLNVWRPGIRVKVVELYVTNNNNLGTYEIDSNRFSLASFLLFTHPAGGQKVPIYVKGIETIANLPPTCNGTQPISVHFGSPATQQFVGADPEQDPLTFTQIGGPGTTSASGLWTLGPTTCQDVGQYQVCATVSDPLHRNADTCCFQLTITQNPPIIACPPNQSVHAGTLIDVPVGASDDNCPGPLTVVVVPPGPGTVVGNAQTGFRYQFQTTCQDVGPTRTVTLEASDGASQTRCTFDVTVTNTPPQITCPGGVIQLQANTCDNEQFPATDADGDPLTYSLGPGSVGTITPGGAYQFCPTPADAGPKSATIIATDPCGAEGRCTKNFLVVVGQKFCLEIDKVTAFLGTHSVQVCVNNPQSGSDPDIPNGSCVGGFDFLFAYDPTCLSFQKATPGSFLTGCEWEFFTYRFGPMGNCGNGCPSGFVRVIALADINDAAQHHPRGGDCSTGNAGQWVCLYFEVTRDRNFQNTCCPIRWWFWDCSDNTISDCSGNQLWTVDSVYNAEGVGLDLAIEYGLGVDVSNCVSSGGPNKPRSKKFICFHDGKICIPADTTIDARGDLNLNGLANEIADAVLYENYFLQGLSVFSSDPLRRQGQIAASNVNNDAFALTVADLVYLIRIITGDAQPYPKVVPGDVKVEFATTRTADGYSIQGNAGVDLGGTLLVFKTTGTVSDIRTVGSASDMNVKFSQEGSQLRVLIYSHERGLKIDAGQSPVLNIVTDGNLTLVDGDASSYDGYPVAISGLGKPVPSGFAVSQNVPNPFNPLTRITLSLPAASNYTLTIYNVAGQVVKSFTGHGEAGDVSITWDGTDNTGAKVASGIYFYKGVAGNSSDTKKMVLMK